MVVCSEVMIQNINNYNWSISSDSNTVVIDDLMKYYFPKNKSNSGLGDITIGMKVLFIGNPAWRGGKNKYSIYGGLDATFPFGESLKKYYYKIHYYYVNKFSILHYFVNYL